MNIIQINKIKVSLAIRRKEKSYNENFKTKIISRNSML